VIDPSVRAVLRSRYTIHRFFLLFGAIFVAALAALWVLELSPEASSMIGAVGAEFLRHLAADDAIVIVTYSFYLFVTPPGLRDAQVIPLSERRDRGWNCRFTRGGVRLLVLGKKRNVFQVYRAAEAR